MKVNIFSIYIGGFRIQEFWRAGSQSEQRVIMPSAFDGIKSMQKQNLAGLNIKDRIYEIPDKKQIFSDNVNTLLLYYLIYLLYL